MEKVLFTKMSGAGNDFIILDKDENIPFVLTDDAVTRLCSRRNGIGADGLITISGSDRVSFEMDYYNRDGSTNTLCGNGARCAVKYAELTGRFSQKGIFTSGGISYSGEILNEKTVKFNLNNPSAVKYNFMVKARGQQIKVHYVYTGSPHVVINIGDILQNPEDPGSGFTGIENIDVFETGREIRYLVDFAPGGANVNFIMTSEDEVFIRTYERGVENETLACGTGAAAAGIVAHNIYKIPKPVVLHTHGGEDLVVDFNSGSEGITGLSLSGPAKVIFTGTFLYKDFF